MNRGKSFAHVKNTASEALPFHEMDPEDQTIQSMSLPTQLLASSASQLPGPARSSFASKHVNPLDHVEQYRLLMDRQREVFDEERNLWYIERSELYEKISKLEASLHKYQLASSDHVHFLLENNDDGSGGISSSTPVGISKHTSTGDEFWRGAGGKSGTQTTRVFSDSKCQPSKVENELSSNAENVAIQSSVDQDSEAVRRKDMHSMTIDKNLDGISFKQNSKVFSISQSFMTPQSPSPIQSPSPTRLSPRGKAKSPLLFAPYDPYTKDAGHTPLARRSDLELNVSAPLSNIAMPPHGSTIGPPCEGEDSYFPSTDEENGDVELKGPLTLTNKNLEDQDFLNKLDSKLQATKENPPDSNNTNKQIKEPSSPSPGVPQPDSEPDPPLRIKKSMNFGAPFGSLQGERGS